MSFTSPLKYPITDTPLNIVSVGLLQEQIVGTAKALDFICASALPVNVGAIEVHFVDTDPDAIPDSDEAIVAAAIAAHTGKQAAEFKASSKLVEQAEVAITDDLTWQVLGGVVTNPSFFVPDVATAFGKIICISKAVDATAELRVVERDTSDNSEVVCCLVQIPETATMQAFDFNTTTPPRAGTMEYRLEGRLNGATSAAVGFASMSLFKGLLEGLRPAT
jgi:hypothetical protein